MTASVGLDDAELDRALVQAVRADRELEREYSGPPRGFIGREPDPE